MSLNVAIAMVSLDMYTRKVTKQARLVLKCRMGKVDKVSLKIDISLQCINKKEIGKSSIEYTVQ